MSRIGRPPGRVRQALEAALGAGLAGGDVLAFACGISPDRARATLKEIQRSHRRQQRGRGDSVLLLQQAWR